MNSYVSVIRSSYKRVWILTVTRE